MFSADRAVGEEADLLDHVADLPPQLGRLAVADRVLADQDVALGDLDRAVDHPHRRRLAAAGGADEDADLAGGNLEGQLVDRRLRGAAVALGRFLVADRGGLVVAHSPSLPARSAARATISSSSGDLAVAHEHPAGDDGGVDDGAGGGVDEVGGEVADAELGGVAARGGGSRRAAPGSSGGARRAAGRAAPVATAQASAASIAVGSAAACFWSRAKRLQVGEQVERVVGAGAVGAEADARRPRRAPRGRGRRRRPRASCSPPGW